MEPLSVNSLEYRCWHELGHAVIAHCVGGIVEFVQVADGDINDKNCFARCGATGPDKKRLVAAGGFASEYVLFKRNLIVNSENISLIEKDFINVSNDNASHDKTSFFNDDLMADGQWPAELDNQFMVLAINQCVPLLEPRFEQMRRLVATLVSEHYLEGSQILAELEG